MRKKSSLRTWIKWHADRIGPFFWPPRCCRDVFSRGASLLSVRPDARSVFSNDFLTTES